MDATSYIWSMAKRKNAETEEYKPEFVSRRVFIELCGGMNKQTLSEAVKNKTVLESDGYLIDKNHPKNQAYIERRLAAVDKNRMSDARMRQDELDKIKLQKEREELRIKQMVRGEKERTLYPVKRFLHLKELYFTNAPKRVHQEHRNWFRVVAKKFNISEEDRLKLDTEFGELINKTYTDELDALESAMKLYDQQGAA